MKILLIDSEIEDIRELKKRIHWEACGVESAATAYSERTARETAKIRNQTLSSAVRKSLRMEERHF